MLQFAALLGAVLDGLSDQDHPNGNYIYAVRDGDSFIYIGNDRRGRLGTHLRPQVCTRPVVAGGV